MGDLDERTDITLRPDITLKKEEEEEEEEGGWEEEEEESSVVIILSHSNEEEEEVQISRYREDKFTDNTLHPIPGGGEGVYIIEGDAQASHIPPIDARIDYVESGT